MLSDQDPRSLSHDWSQGATPADGNRRSSKLPMKATKLSQSAPSIDASEHYI